jgi:hypothetical protein
VAVVIGSSASLFLYRDVAMISVTRREKPAVEAAAFLALTAKQPALCESVFRIIPFSTAGRNYWARSGDLTFNGRDFARYSGVTVIHPQALATTP